MNAIEKATLCVGSDRYAGHITQRTPSGRYIKFVHAKVVAAPGHSYYGTQCYAVEPNPDGRYEWLSKRKDGYYRVVGLPTGVCHLGVHDHYVDPSF